MHQSQLESVPESGCSLAGTNGNVAPAIPVTLPIEFFAFDEDHCLQVVAKLRWPEGFCCDHCSCRQSYTIRARGLWQCTSCRAQFSVTAGTFMESTRLPMTKWFRAIHVLINSEHMTINDFGQLLSLRYKTAWLLKYKIDQAQKSESGRAFVQEIARIMLSYRAG
jgi:hypothetical protein